jgi:hypothetical protein
MIIKDIVAYRCPYCEYGVIFALSIYHYRYKERSYRPTPLHE